jgi:hypothetical protein
MKAWSENIDPATIPDDVLKSERARRNSLRRQTFSGGHEGGRPRSAGPRCPCGAMTAARAKARRHKCESA